MTRASTSMCRSLEPMITYGTNPGMSIPISGRVPQPDERGRCCSAEVHGARAGRRRCWATRSMSFSSAAARTAACRISGAQRAFCVDAR